MQYLRLLILSTVLATGPSGCIAPWPHTSERSAELRGRVLDDRTHDPVCGAKVFCTGRPTISTESDGTGHFRLKATRNLHLAYVGAEAQDWPVRHFYSDVTVSHPKYQARQFVGWQLWDFRDTNSTSVVDRLIVLQDVLLNQKPQ